jgi:putative DNA primase/helicase
VNFDAVKQLLDNAEIHVPTPAPVQLTSALGGTASVAPPQLSEDALALAYAQAAALRFRWSPGLGWMVYEAGVWSRDERMQRSVLAREVCRHAAAYAYMPGDAKRLASARTVNAVVTLAQSDQSLVVENKAWDADLMLLNTPAGLVDLRTGMSRPHDGTYVTHSARVSPSQSPAPVWERFVREVFCGDSDFIRYAQRVLGYCLTGDRREQVLFFWYGEGANGKSVLADFIQWLCGGYAIKLPSTALMQAKGERHPTELAQLRGKRLAISSELDEGAFFNESLVKELTGDATLSARFMRMDFFEFEMTQKHVVIGNFKPRLRGGDAAMARRMQLLPFQAKFTGPGRDPHMLEKLKQEAPAILQWIIEGAVQWSSEGLAVPCLVREASAEYMAEHDDLAMWQEECCEPAGETRADALYESFVRWKKARGEHPPSQTAWGNRLASRPGISKRRSNGIRYAGIRLSAVEISRLGSFR